MMKIGQFKFTIFIFIFSIFSLVVNISIVFGQEETDLNRLANEISKDGINIERAKRINTWITDNFKFVYTDYKSRTVHQLIDRRAGNCAEQARVLRALLDEINVPTRWVAEINIQPKNEQREKDAEEMISTQGFGASVFGLMHNDHRWLEVFDDIRKVWVPADPSLGIFGVESWIKTRVGFTERPEHIKDMIVPFVVVVKEDGKIVENRSDHYLIDGFNSLYNNELAKLNAWKDWVHLIKQLSTYGALSLTGDENLHLHTNLMEQLLITYEELKSEFSDLEKE